MTEDKKRAQFEAWVSGDPYARNIERLPDNSAWPGGYKCIHVALAWAAWCVAWGRGYEYKANEGSGINHG